MIETKAIGNLGKDAETVTINNKEYMKYSLAVTNMKTAMWVDVISPLNEKILPYLKRGVKVFVSGMPSVNAYMSKESEPKGSITIWSSYMELISSKKENEELASAPSTTTPSPSKPTQPTQSDEFEEEDLPF